MKISRVMTALILIFSLTIAFSACSSVKHIATIDGSEFSFELLGNNKLTGIRVKRGDELHSVFNTAGVIFKSLGGSNGFEIIDMNFDGHDDFRVTVSIKEKSLKYYCMLYDESTDSFLYSEKLSEIYGFTADSETKTLTSHRYIRTEEETGPFNPDRHTESYITAVYEWKNGELSVLSSVTLSYYAESEIYCLTFSELSEDGVLEETGDEWIEPEDIGNYSEYYPEGIFDINNN